MKEFLALTTAAPSAVMAPAASANGASGPYEMYCLSIELLCMLPHVTTSQSAATHASSGLLSAQ